MEEASELTATAQFSEHETREVRMTDGGEATIHRPASGESKGSILMLPGWSGPRTGPADVLVHLASELARKGWTSIRLDLPGRGDMLDPVDAVDLDQMITSAAATSFEFSVGKKEPDPSRRVLLGICSGGNVALGAAPVKTCSKFQRVVAISTFPFQPARTKTFENRRRWKNLKNYARKAFSLSTWLRLFKGEINTDRVIKNVSSTEKKAGARNLKDSARDIEGELKEWKGAALFVWGGGDEEAPPARTHFEKLHANGFGEKNRVVFHTVPGANHNFYGKAWRSELLEKITAFFEQ